MASLLYGFGKNRTDDAAKPFQIMSGRDIFNHRSLTGQNRSPIEDLKSYTLAGMRAGTLPFPADTLCEALLVDGTVVLYNGKLMADVYAATPEYVIQYLRDKDGELDFIVDGDDMTDVRAEVWREWLLTDAGWTVEDVVFDDQGEVQERIPVEVIGLEDADIYVFPNDRGILYYPQEVYWLLEESKAMQRRLMRGSNVLPIIDSDAPPDTWRTAYSTGKNAIIAPYDKLNYPVSASVMQALSNESDDARRDWLDSLNVVEKDAPQRPSGRDREIRTRAMVNFIRTLREDIAAIYAANGASVEFTEQVIIASAAERIQELDLIERLEQSRTLMPDEANELKRKLV